MPIESVSDVVVKRLDAFLLAAYHQESPLHAEYLSAKEHALCCIFAFCKKGVYGLTSSFKCKCHQRVLRHESSTNFTLLSMTKHCSASGKKSRYWQLFQHMHTLVQGTMLNGLTLLVCMTGRSRSQPDRCAVRAVAQSEG